MRYSDHLADWLRELGYTHCFFVAGGNIMHLLASVSERFTCVPVVHEVTAGIAVEYFNESSSGQKAFALVTAGPGLTNIVTAIGGAWLESRELLVLGGQVKTADLSNGTLRQRGIQEINGVDIVRPITSRSVLMERVFTRDEFMATVNVGATARKGPVFIEIPLDIQGRDVDMSAVEISRPLIKPGIAQISSAQIEELISRLQQATRPVLLLGGGVDRTVARQVSDALARCGIPLMTTWNGADRVASDHPMYFGRPNTWGQRYSNILLQQADLLVALGTRLGMQQTGFNWQEFVPVGKVIQIDCDSAELGKEHPVIDLGFAVDANDVLKKLMDADLGEHGEWVEFCREVKRQLPLIEPVNQTGERYLSPYVFAQQLSALCLSTDRIVPCSSGSAFTVMMQTFDQKAGQIMVTDKGLASMGYGLGGAIGVSFAHRKERTILVEGDGGFSQNLQELGTVAVNRLNLKIFIFDDSGYASIRMTQRNYFGGKYVGCDRTTGLGLPDWEKLFNAWDLPVMRIGCGYETNEQFLELFNAEGPAGFIVGIDPEQTYFPKITSRVTESGGMVSNPLHKMSPDLSEDQCAKVMKFVKP